MNDFQKIHDFLKYNYEKGNFKINDYHNTDYYNYKQSFYERKSTENDFILGFEKAKNDFYQGKRFKHYPITLIKIINKFFNNKFKEIIEFINGYNKYKNDMYFK